MATESTAIHDLLSGFNRKAIPDDPDDDVLFAGSRRREDATEVTPKQPATGHPGMFSLPTPAPLPPPPAAPYAAAARMPAGTPPFAPPTRTAAGTQPPPVGGYSASLSGAYAAPIHTAPGAPTIQLQLQTIVPLPQPFARQPTHAIAHMQGGTSRWSAFRTSSAKIYALPVGLFVVVVVLLGVYLAPGEKHAAASGATPVAQVESAPVESAPEAVTAEPMAAPTAEPIAAPMAEPTVMAAPVEAPPAPAVVEAPVAAAAEAPAEPVAPALPNDAIAPPTVVPASAFAVRTETTVPTVTVNPLETAPTETPTVAAAIAKTAPAAEPAPAAPKIKKSKRDLAREKRAAKRATKRATKTRVATAPKAEKAVASDKSQKSAKAESLNGNGALAITSAAPREVWVDGRNSKRMTPLRVLLKPGKHTVTLFDKEHGTAKSFQVEIKADTTTKISK